MASLCYCLCHVCRNVFLFLSENDTGIRETGTLGHLRSHLLGAILSYFAQYCKGSGTPSPRPTPPCTPCLTAVHPPVQPNRNGICNEAGAYEIPFWAFAWFLKHRPIQIFVAILTYVLCTEEMIVKQEPFWVRPFWGPGLIVGGEGSQVKKAKGWPKGEGSKGKRRRRGAGLGCEPRELPGRCGKQKPPLRYMGSGIRKLCVESQNK